MSHLLTVDAHLGVAARLRYLAYVTPLGLLHMRPLQHRVPRVGMAERHAVGPSHSSLPPNLQPVVRPFVPSGRSAPWNRSPGTLWFTGMPLPRAGGPRSTPWCRHHHFGESTVYETCLCLEVEPVRRMVLFSQRRPPEMPDQICAVLLAARVGAKTVSLHPQGLCSRDCCQPRPCGREVGGEA